MDAVASPSTVGDPSPGGRGRGRGRGRRGRPPKDPSAPPRVAPSRAPRGRGRGRGRGRRGAAEDGPAPPAPAAPVDGASPAAAAAAAAAAGASAAAAPAGPAAVRKRGLFARELPLMMYGCGDDPAPLPESVDVVEDAVADFVAAVGRRAIAGGGGSAAPLSGARLQPEDVLFLVRKDAKFFGRCTELLALADDIAAAKKAFDEVDG